jgi:hypothetical protein
MNLYIRPGGNTQCIYDEKLNLGEIGAIAIRRASHVEPDPRAPGNWFVDLSPVSGPVVREFNTRKDALDYEIAWIESRLRQQTLQVLET